MQDAPLILVIAALERRTTGKYGQRGVRYVHMEAGHAAQNVLLQARALGLDAGLVGAFTDADVQRVVGLPSDTQPLYLVPVGRPAR
jgi:SagB-type dehydrogenase family enzyme